LPRSSPDVVACCPGNYGLHSFLPRLSFVAVASLFVPPLRIAPAVGREENEPDDTNQSRRERAAERWQPCCLLRLRRGLRRLAGGCSGLGYALFFLNDGALEYLDSSAGFELGVGPSLVVDAGVAKSISSTTITQDVYAFIFDQKGLMAGLGIQGSKITRISK
jgi:hypothetical protein